MSNGKKGLHPLAWVAIGCGALIVIVGLVLTLGLGYLGFKAKQFVEEYEQNPALGVAHVIAATNPEVEIESSDETAKTVTFRNTKTDELVTINYKDLEEGRVSFESSEGSFEIDSSEEGGGTVTMTNEDGETVYQAGTAVDADVPAWVPMMSGVTLTPVVQQQNPEGKFASFQVTFPEGTEVKEVFDFYQQQLEAEGFKVDRAEQTVNGQVAGTVIGDNAAAGQNVTIFAGVDDQGAVGGMLTVTEKGN